MQNLCWESHSSVTVRRFRKLKSCCYIIAIPSGWHRCPNPNCKCKVLKQEKTAMCYSFQVPACCITYAQPICESHLGVDGRELSVLTTRPPSLQHCSNKMSYLNQMYEKKAMSRA